MYKLKYKGQEIDELLEQVDEKTIYDNATVEKDGLMSSSDKKKLETIKAAKSISYFEILTLFKHAN